jgi:hypothetical protein
LMVKTRSAGDANKLQAQPRSLKKEL